MNRAVLCLSSVPLTLASDPAMQSALAGSCLQATGDPAAGPWCRVLLASVVSRLLKSASLLRPVDTRHDALSRALRATPSDKRAPLKTLIPGLSGGIHPSIFSERYAKLFRAFKRCFLPVLPNAVEHRITGPMAPNGPCISQGELWAPQGLRNQHRLICGDRTPELDPKQAGLGPNQRTPVFPAQGTPSARRKGRASLGILAKP